MAVAVGLIAIVATACQAGTAGGLSGRVEIDGSSTVFPITEAFAEEFQLMHRGVRVTVGVSGTGGGFEKFCNGETQISDASRPIKQSERDRCEANGIEWIELPVALDGLVVATSRDTGYISCLTLDELETIFEPSAARRITRWDQVRAGLPHEEIQIFSPGVDSGSFDFFTEEVVGESGASRADVTASEDDNVLVLGVSATEGSLGYFGFAYFVENREIVKALEIDGGDGCVAPADDVISSGRYPLARPLFIYVSVAALNQRPQVREFVRFYVSEEAQSLIDEIGYTPLAPEQREASREAVEAAITAPDATPTPAATGGPSE